jgi:hypothetical protein
MSKPIRALFISAVATVVALGAVTLLSGRKQRLPGRSETGLPGEVDTEEISPEQAAALMKELDAHL